eukprot:1521642-Prymnesium_polylepis.1
MCIRDRVQRAKRGSQRVCISPAAPPPETLRVQTLIERGAWTFPHPRLRVGDARANSRIRICNGDLRNLVHVACGHSNQLFAVADSRLILSYTSTDTTQPSVAALAARSAVHSASVPFCVLASSSWFSVSSG